jgi:hypothetical protein
MAFEFAYSKTGDGVLAAKNFELASGYTPTKGDVVKFDGSQKLVKAVAADTTVLGVLESAVFEGVGVAVKTGQIKYSSEAIYRVKYDGTTPVVGTAYALKTLASGDQVIDGANAGAGKIYRVIGVDTANTLAYVGITSTTY